MLRVAFCPCSPLVAAEGLVGDVPEAEAVRRAALAAVRELVDGDPTSVVVVGADVVPVPGDERSGGSLAPHGIDVSAGGPDGGLGLAHTVGAWLLDQVGWTGPRSYLQHLRSADLDDAAVLVMADGSATRSERAPGHLDDRAAPFDAAVVAALAEGDADALGGIDLELAEALWCTGAPVWRTVGDTVAARVHVGDRPTADGSAAAGDRAVHATVHHDDAPLGVGWFVAEWRVP